MEGHSTERRHVEGFDLIEVALWNSATIAYARCFVTGLRREVSTDLVPDDLRKAHKDLIKMRGEHIAHFDRGSTHESVTVRALIRETETSVIVDVTTQGVKDMLPTPNVMPEYIALVTRVLAAAEAKYQRTLDEIDAALQAVSASRLLQTSNGSAVRLG
jgi:hypothetical protein